MSWTANERKRNVRYHRTEMESSVVTAVGGAAQLVRAAKDNGRRRNMRYRHADMESSAVTAVGGAAQLAIAAQVAAQEAAKSLLVDDNMNFVGSTVEAWGSVNSKSFKRRQRRRNVRYHHKELGTAVKTVVGAKQLARAPREAEIENKRKKHITIPELAKKLNVQPLRRTEVDCILCADALFDFVTSMEAWKDGFVKADALAMARDAEVETVDANQTVFSQGEIGDKFYFVLQGSVAIKLNYKVVKVLGKKTSFGELAMLCKCKRSASVLGAEDDTKLLVIRKKLYHRHLAKLHRKDMSSKMKFLKKLNAGQLTPEEVATLCICIKMQKVTKNQKICSFNDPAKCIYYLVEGSAEQRSRDNGELLQKLLRDGKYDPVAVVDNVCKRLTLSEQKGKRIKAILKKVIDTNLRKQSQSEMHRIATLVEGQIFGEASWVYGQQAMTTVVARSDCKVWVLPFVHVNKIVATQIEVREHLEKLARMKLQFRLERFNTSSRASKCLQPAVKRQTSRTWAGTPEPKIYSPISSRLGQLTIPGTSTGPRPSNEDMPISRPNTAKSSNGHAAGRRTGKSVTPRMRRGRKAKPGFARSPRRRCHSLTLDNLPLVSDAVRERRHSQLKCRFRNKCGLNQRRARPGRTYVLTEFQLSNIKTSAGSDDDGEAEES